MFDLNIAQEILMLAFIYGLFFGAFFGLIHYLWFGFFS